MTPVDHLWSQTAKYESCPLAKISSEKSELGEKYAQIRHCVSTIQNSSK